MERLRRGTLDQVADQTLYFRLGERWQVLAVPRRSQDVKTHDNVSTKNAPKMSVVARAHRLHDRLWDLLLVLAERAHLTLWLTLHGEGPSLAQSRRLVGCDLQWHLPPPRHRQRREPPEWRPHRSQPSWPTERQATDILVLVSTDIPVRCPLTFSCGFTPGRLAGSRDWCE